MPTAPPLVAANVVTSDVGGLTSVTSASLSLQAGDVVTIIAVGEGQATGNTYGTPTTTFANGGITQLKLHPSASDCQGGAWTFTVSTTGSGTVTVPNSASVTDRTTLTVAAHRGATAATATRSALSTGSGRMVSYTPSQADSAIVWGLGDWGAAAAQTPTPTSTSHTSASPGPTAMPYSATVSGVYTKNSAVLDDQTSTGAVSYGIGGTVGGPFTILVVEIQGTGGGSTPNPFHPKPASRAPIFRASTF